MKMTNIEFAKMIETRNSNYESVVRNANAELQLSEEQITELVEFNNKYQHIFITALKMAKNAEEAWTAFDRARSLGMEKMKEMLSSENFAKITKQMSDAKVDEMMKTVFESLEYIDERTYRAKEIALQANIEFMAKEAGIAL